MSCRALASSSTPSCFILSGQALNDGGGNVFWSLLCRTGLYRWQYLKEKVKWRRASSNSSPSALVSNPLVWNLMRACAFQTISSDEVLSASLTPSNNAGCCSPCFLSSFKHIVCSTAAFCLLVALAYMFSSCGPPEACCGPAKGSAHSVPVTLFRLTPVFPLWAAAVSVPGSVWA